MQQDTSARLFGSLHPSPIFQHELRSPLISEMGLWSWDVGKRQERAGKVKTIVGRARSVRMEGVQEPFSCSETKVQTSDS